MRVIAPDVSIRQERKDRALDVVAQLTRSGRLVTGALGYPEQLRRSLTWDQGAQMAQHVRPRIDTGLQV